MHLRSYHTSNLHQFGILIVIFFEPMIWVFFSDRKIRLRAGRMTSPDIRAGIALLIAALSANGTSRIANIAQIDRGYENIENRLNALGANIRRVND